MGELTQFIKLTKRGGGVRRQCYKKTDRGNRSVLLNMLCYYVKAIPHKDCAPDASSNFSSDETKSEVNTECIHEHFCEI